jgi:hypothetical protein
MPDGEPVSPAELGLALMSSYPVGVRGDIVLADQGFSVGVSSVSRRK